MLGSRDRVLGLTASDLGSSGTVRCVVCVVTELLGSDTGKGSG